MAGHETGQQLGDGGGVGVGLDGGIESHENFLEGSPRRGSTGLLGFFGLAMRFCMRNAGPA
jgi:hypothetical protein